MLCLNGFELYSRWVPLTMASTTNQIHSGCYILTYGPPYDIVTKRN